MQQENWSEIIDDELSLDTIADKHRHGSIHIKIEGDTYRKTKAQKLKLDKA